MLLCLGLCFVVGGIRREESTFNEAVSEVGTGLLLTAGFGLAIPTVFAHSLKNRIDLDADALSQKVLEISRSSAILLMLSYLIFVFFQSRSHHSLGTYST
jgi:Ca2+:H+ antiporter